VLTPPRAPYNGCLGFGYIRVAEPRAARPRASFYRQIARAALRALRFTVCLTAGSPAVVRAFAYRFRALSLRASSSTASPLAKRNSRPFLLFAKIKRPLTIHSTGSSYPPAAGRTAPHRHHNRETTPPFASAASSPFGCQA
jgi:hypothetical protein